LLNNNRISKIESGLETYVPNLHTIILTNNLINELGDLEPLTKLKKLTHLSLLDNPVAKKQHYRLYVIYKFPQLRVLDFNKVKLAEKNQAIALFSEENGADNDFVKSITENKSKSNEFAS
jgi:U2 small nuclear ribonucleoprotein A'